MRKYIVGFLVGAVFTISTTGFADTVITKVDAYFNSSIPIIVDGKQLTLDKPVAIIDGSSYVPLKLIGETMGKKVSWNDTTKSIEMTSIPNSATSQQNIVYYKYDVVNAKYPAYFHNYDEENRAVITVGGKNYHVKQDVFVDKSKVVYNSKETFLQYLTEEQLKEFQKYQIDTASRVSTPIN